ncbi:MAG: maleylpyruvate isomerase family mycothiol-dependent enzyme [Acidimicrobiales bacterium]
MDTSEAYRTVRERMLGLVDGVDPTTPVPPCPEWTVRELLAHVTGVAADVVAGRLEGAGTDPWVEAQLSARARAPIEEIAAEWAETGPQVDDICAALGDGIAQLIFDTVSHEQDLRNALRHPGGRHGALGIAVRWVSDAWAGGALPSGALRIVAGPVDVTRGESTPIASVLLEPFEALRTLSGRRSSDQILALPWDGDPKPSLGAFTWGPFTPRVEPLAER